MRCARARALTFQSLKELDEGRSHEGYDEEGVRERPVHDLQIALIDVRHGTYEDAQ